MDLAIPYGTEISKKLNTAIGETLAVCFPHHKDKFSKTYYLNGNKPMFSIIIEDGGNVIAYAGVIDRTIKIGGKKCRVAGVQNVCVLPKYRNRRLIDGVLKAAMEEAHTQGFDFGLLFTQQNIEKVYTRNGWVRISKSKFIRTEDGVNVEVPPESIKMYYPLVVKDFPAGDVDLQGDKW